MNKPHILLLDGDILRYELGAVASKGDTVTIGEHKIDVPQTRQSVERLVTDKVKFILERTGCTEIGIFLSEGKNFRFVRATIQPYKGNREGFVKPYHWKTVGDVLYQLPEAVQFTCRDYEADDYLAACQDVDNGTTCIASRDKDLRGYAGWHYSWPVGERSPEKPLEWISKLEGDRWFYTQCLTGDSTDHIIGCGVKRPTKSGQLRRKGVGPKAASELLVSAENEQEMFNVVALQYQALFGDDWQEHLKENGTLLYMSAELTPWEELDKTEELFRNFINEQSRAGY